MKPTGKIEHGLSKYGQIANIITTDSPLTLVEKIKENPEDYKRYKFYLSELNDDPALSFNLIEISRIAAILMQLERYDAWAYEKGVDELSQFETTNDRIRKMNEFVLNYIERAKKKSVFDDTIQNAKELVLELKGESGDVKLEWKKEKEPLDITSEGKVEHKSSEICDVEFKEIE